MYDQAIMEECVRPRKSYAKKEKHYFESIESKSGEVFGEFERFEKKMSNFQNEKPL